MSEEIDNLMRRVRASATRTIRRTRKRDFDRKYNSFKTDFDRKEDPSTMLEEVTQTQTEYFLSASSLNDHYISKLMSKRIDFGLNTVTHKENLICDVEKWVDFVRLSATEENIQVIEFTDKMGMIVDHLTMDFLDYSVSSNLIEVKLFGSQEYVDSMHQKLVKTFSVASCYIEWVYGGNGDSVNIPLLPEKLPVSEMYPFLGDETVEEYYDRFLNSSASILLLIGPPGTGKTTFIRGLLHHASRNAIVTYDDKILERDYIFAHFIEDETGVMVIEDADNFLKPRADGNTMMHRFLNVGDGLISMKGKKLIFSTNLPSINDIDSALIRPGRCFDIISFQQYTKEQAQKIAKKFDLKLAEKDNNSDTYSLAEIFHTQNNTKPNVTRKMGFV
jgi:ATPase family associated with various cellular activities (AAA)